MESFKIGDHVKFKTIKNGKFYGYESTIYEIQDTYNSEQELYYFVKPKGKYGFWTNALAIGKTNEPLNEVIEQLSLFDLDNTKEETECED